MNEEKNVTIAVDFDGTCVEHEYPKVGPDVPYAVDVLRHLSGPLGCPLVFPPALEGRRSYVDWARVAEGMGIMQEAFTAGLKK